MILHALWQIQHQIDETFALDTEPTESLNTDVEVCQLVLIAIDGHLVLREGDILGVGVVGGTKECTRMGTVDRVCLQDWGPVDRHVRRDEKGKEFVLTR